MDRTALVTGDIAAGRKFIRALTKAGVAVVAAMWVYYSENGEWRLLVAVGDEPFDRHATYRKAIEIIDRRPELDAHISLSQIKLVSANDPVTVALSKKARFGDRDTVRFSDNVVNGELIEGAVVYRMAA